MIHTSDPTERPADLRPGQQVQRGFSYPQNACDELMMPFGYSEFVEYLCSQCCFFFPACSSYCGSLASVTWWTGAGQLSKIHSHSIDMNGLCYFGRLWKLGSQEAPELHGIFPIHAPVSRDSKELFLCVASHSQAGRNPKQAGDVTWLDVLLTSVLKDWSTFSPGTLIGPYKLGSGGTAVKIEFSTLRNL